jgi:hypothetical protein
LFAACHDANINVAIQMLMECLLISILAATRDPAEAQTAFDEVARVMCSEAGPRGRQWTAGPTKRDERPEGAYQISRQGGQHLGRPRGSARVAAREAQGWCQTRRLCRSKDSGFSQSFPEKNKETPTQKVTRFIRLLSPPLLFRRDVVGNGTLGMPVPEMRRR